MHSINNLHLYTYFYFLVIVDSHAIEKILKNLAVFPLVVTTWKTILQHHIQDTDTNINHYQCSNFPGFACTHVFFLCVFNYTFYHLCRFVYPLPKLWFRKVPLPQTFLILPYYNHTRVSHPSCCTPLSNTWQLLTCPYFQM